MKLKLNNEYVIAKRITKEYAFTLTNNKGEEMDVTYQTYERDEDGAYDNDQMLLDENGNELSSEVLETFLGEDYDEDLISHFEEAIGNKINDENDTELVFINDNK